MASFVWFLLAFLGSLSLMKDSHLFCNGDRTNDSTAVRLTEKNFEAQWP